MIDVQTSVSTASKYIESLKYIMVSSLPDLRIEEVELTEDRYFRLITLGFDTPIKPQENSFTTTLGLLIPTSPRQYGVKFSKSTHKLER